MEVELWKSNGTAIGTVRVKEIVPQGGGIDASNLTDVDGRLFFSLDNGGEEIWTSDGNEAGTLMLKRFENPDADISSYKFTAHEGRLYYFLSSSYY